MNEEFPFSKNFVAVSVSFLSVTTYVSGTHLIGLTVHMHAQVVQFPVFLRGVIHNRSIFFTIKLALGYGSIIFLLIA